MLAEKRQLRSVDLEAQTVLELPRREMMLVTVVITNLLNNATINIPVQNNKIAVQVCAAVDLISAEFFTGDPLTCEIEQ